MSNLLIDDYMNDVCKGQADICLPFASFITPNRNSCEVIKNIYDDFNLSDWKIRVTVSDKEYSYVKTKLESKQSTIFINNNSGHDFTYILAHELGHIIHAKYERYINIDMFNALFINALPTEYATTNYKEAVAELVANAYCNKHAFSIKFIKGLRHAIN